MNIPKVAEAAPGFGSVRSPVVIVGQSLCRQCMEKQVPSAAIAVLTVPRAVKVSPDLLFPPHPSWIKRQHDDSLEQQYVTRLARALK